MHNYSQEKLDPPWWHRCILRRPQSCLLMGDRKVTGTWIMRKISADKLHARWRTQIEGRITILKQAMPWRMNHHVCNPVSPLSLHPCSELLCRDGNVSGAIRQRRYTQCLQFYNHMKNTATQKLSSSMEALPIMYGKADQHILQSYRSCNGWFGLIPWCTFFTWSLLQCNY